MAKTHSDIGLIGLAVMGQNLALNIADHGFKISVYNRTVEKTDKFVAENPSTPGGLVGTKTLQEFAASLAKPRKAIIRVQAGKLTDVTVNHRAAAITLKLVTEKGGEALANTAWSVLTPGGDVIKESIGAFPRVILAEGEYRAIARNEGKVYEREFKVVAGVDGDVEVMAQ